MTLFLEDKHPWVIVHLWWLYITEWSSLSTLFLDFVVAFLCKFLCVDNFRMISPPWHRNNSSKDCNTRTKRTTHHTHTVTQNDSTVTDTNNIHETVVQQAECPLVQNVHDEATQTTIPIYSVAHHHYTLPVLSPVLLFALYLSSTGGSLRFDHVLQRGVVAIIDIIIIITVIHCARCSSVWQYAIHVLS